MGQMFENNLAEYIGKVPKWKINFEYGETNKKKFSNKTKWHETNQTHGGLW